MITAMNAGMISNMKTMIILDLPCDIINTIKKCIISHDSLKNFKSVCKYTNNLVSQFDLKKKVLERKLSCWKPKNYCINIDCYYDTDDIYEFVYNHGFRHYIHSHQWALNYHTININSKTSSVHTAYCCECFKKYVLIGDRKNVVDKLIQGVVNIEYR